jgi:hypothetical protein
MSLCFFRRRRCFQWAVLELEDPDTSVVLQGCDLEVHVTAKPPEVQDFHACEDEFDHAETS